MTAGPLLPNVLAFAVPLILSGMLQLLYNSADIIVVGRFADSVAMASVGATTSLIHLLVSLLMGLSVGASVAVARAAGAGDRDGVHREWFSMPYQDGPKNHFIWGATAGMLRNFYRFMQA